MRLVRGAGDHIGSDQDDSRQQSCAGAAVPRSGGGCAVPESAPSGQSGVCARVARRRDGRKCGHPVGGWCHIRHRVPSSIFFHAFSPCFGHLRALKSAFRGRLRVVGRFRRVVVARRCTQHHLRRVMVETPPRAGPSPPPTDRPVFSWPGASARRGGGPGAAGKPRAVPVRAQVTDRAPPPDGRRARPPRTLGAPAPAGVRFAFGDRHTDRGRPLPRPGRPPRDAAGERRACPIRTEGLTIT